MHLIMIAVPGMLKSTAVIGGIVHDAASKVEQARGARTGCGYAWRIGGTCRPCSGCG